MCGSSIRQQQRKLRLYCVNKRTGCKLLEGRHLTIVRGYLQHEKWVINAMAVSNDIFIHH